MHYTLSAAEDAVRTGDRRLPNSKVAIIPTNQARSGSLHRRNTEHTAHDALATPSSARRRTRELIYLRWAALPPQTKHPIETAAISARPRAAEPPQRPMDARDIYAKFSRPGQLSPPPSPPKRVSFVRDADIEIFLDGSDSDDAPPGRVPLPVATPLKNEAADVDSPLKTPRSPQSSRNDALRRRIERAIGSPPRTPQSSFGERDDDVSSVASSSVASSLMSDDDHQGSMVTVAVYAQDGSTLKVLRVPRGTNRALLASSVARQAGVSPSRCRVVDASPNSQASERRAARRRRREARAKAKQPKSRMAAFLAGAAIASAAACCTLAAYPYLHKRPTALVISNEDVTDLRAELEALRRDLAASRAEVSRISKRVKARHAGTDRSLRSLAGGLLDVASLGALRRAAAARDAAARKRNPGAFTKKTF